MNEMNNSPTCERASELVAFLYNEANEAEGRDFEFHLKECDACRQEAASFRLVRESITAWREEALAGFVSSPLATTARKKSAMAALREFFDLSPLWLKGATGMAVVAFCVLGVLAFININSVERSGAESSAGNYTQKDVDRLVNEALARQQISIILAQPDEKPIVAPSSKPRRITTEKRFAKSRRPLTRAEREQLAVDLRLLSTDDETGLNLLGDRINQ